MITFERRALQEQLFAALAVSPVTALLGPRQAGKTFLAKSLQVSSQNYFDLEDDISLVRLESGAQSALGSLHGLVIIDEIQRRSELFSALRVLADRRDAPARFLILGSASPALLKDASESLAGRIRFIDMGGLHVGELPPDELELAWSRLWLVGGFPKAFIASDPDDSFRWRRDYLRTLVERDLRELAETRLTPDQIRRLLLLAAHYHGQPWNHKAVADTIGVTHKTVHRHMEILKAAFLIRELPPFHANVGKRLRKAPRFYYRDSGLLHALLGLQDMTSLKSNPAMGASWEGFCIEQTIRSLGLDESACSCYGVQSGTEMDLVVELPTGPVGFEFKASPTPKRTRSMVESIADLGLKRVIVVYPGDISYPLDDKIEVLPLKMLDQARELLT